MDSLDDEQCEMHVFVKGQVQGVGFRATTRYCAKKLGVRGTVKNLPDGRVEIFAQGSKQLLERLLQEIKNELGASLIEEFQIKYLPIEKVHEDFRIIY
ncbi:MAG: acylphosphatase [Parachlamydiaceae bacterium]|nr:acylphosphatase [Parachlamydiaceae bacterium]